MKNLFGRLSIAMSIIVPLMLASTISARYITLVVNKSDNNLLVTSAPDAPALQLKKEGTINPFNYDLAQQELRIQNPSDNLLSVVQLVNDKIQITKSIPGANPTITTYSIPKNNEHFTLTVNKDFSVKIEPVFYIKYVKNNSDTPYDFLSRNPITFLEEGIFGNRTEPYQRRIYHVKTPKEVNGHLTVGEATVTGKGTHTIFINKENKIQIDGPHGKKIIENLTPGAFMLVINESNEFSAEPLP